MSAEQRWFATPSNHENLDNTQEEQKPMSGEVKEGAVFGNTGAAEATSEYAERQKEEDGFELNEAVPSWDGKSEAAEINGEFELSPGEEAYLESLVKKALIDFRRARAQDALEAQ